MKRARGPYVLHRPATTIWFCALRVCVRMIIYWRVNTISARRSWWECHPTILHPDCISLHLHLNLLARLLSPCPRSHGDVVCVIKNILPPLAIHLLLSISSCWIWLDWCWVLHAATWCFTCLPSCVFLHSAWRRVWAARRQCCCCVLFVGLSTYVSVIKSPDLAE